MKTFAESDFVVVFTGEGAWSTLCHGWEATKTFALSQFLTLDDDPEMRESYVRELEDDDNWEYTECGKGVDDRLVCRHVEIGEISSMMIVRIIESTPEAKP